MDKTIVHNLVTKHNFVSFFFLSVRKSFLYASKTYFSEWKIYIDNPLKKVCSFEIVDLIFFFLLDIVSN